jgi:type IV secretory pathway VirB2 component (pilin)
MTAKFKPLEVLMPRKVRITILTAQERPLGRQLRQSAFLLIALLTLPLTAHALAGGSPFDTGFAALQDLFTGTVAKVASLIAIVIGGYGFAHGEPGAKKAACISFRVLSRHRPQGIK